MKTEKQPLNLSGIATHKVHKVQVTLSFEIPIVTVDIPKKSLDKINDGGVVFYQGKVVMAEEELNARPKNLVKQVFLKSGFMHEEDVDKMIETGQYLFNETVESKIIKVKDLKTGPFQFSEFCLTQKEIKACTQRLVDEKSCLKRSIDHVRKKTEEFVCLGCGCTDSHACEDVCYWLAVDPDSGFGICSNCNEYLDQYTRGDK